MPQNNPFQPPQAVVADVDDSGELDIDSLDVSDAWKKRFHWIRKAGGPGLPLLNSLPKEERRGGSPFNILAFLFGGFYYLAKGMWRKAISLMVVMIVVLSVVDLVLELIGFGLLGNVLNFGAAAVFAVRANIDYYKKMVLNDNGWW